MPTVFVPFVNLSFNSGKLNSDGLIRADGVIHGGKGFVAPPPFFRPAGDFEAMSEDAADPVFAHVNRAAGDSKNFSIYFYADGALYRIDVSGAPPWTVEAVGTVSTPLDPDEGGFVGYGESEIFAAGLSNAVQILLPGGSAFEDCFVSDDKPKAKHVAVIGQRLLFGSLADLSDTFDPDPNRSLLWWGGTDKPRVVGDELSYPRDNTGWQPIADDYGDIRALANGRDHATIFKELSIWTMDLGGSGFFFRANSQGVGTRFTHSVAQMNDDDFVFSTNGPAVVRSGQLILLGDGFWSEGAMLLDSPAVPGLNVLSAAADSKNGVVYWLMEYDTQDYTFTEGNPPTEVIAGSGKTYALLAYNSKSNQFSFVWRERSEDGGVLMTKESEPGTAHRYRPICLVDRIPWNNSLPMDGIGILAVEASSTNDAGPRFPTLFLAGLPSTDWTPEWTLGVAVTLQTGLVPFYGPKFGSVRGIRPILRARRGQSLPTCEVTVRTAKTPWQVEKRTGPFSTIVNTQGFISPPGVPVGNLVGIDFTVSPRSVADDDSVAWAAFIEELEGVEVDFDERG